MRSGFDRTGLDAVDQDLRLVIHWLMKRKEGKGEVRWGGGDGGKNCIAGVYVE